MDIRPLPDLGKPIQFDTLPEASGQLTLEGYQPEKSSSNEDQSNGKTETKELD